MKNLLKKYTGILSLLSFLLILPIHYANSQNIDELFGVKLFDNATNYVSSEYIESNKRKYKETISGYWIVDVYDVLNNAYFDRFQFIIDDNNKIHLISGGRDYLNEERCNKFMDPLKEQLENIKSINLVYGEQDYGRWFLKRFYYENEGLILNLQCNHYFDPVRDVMKIYIRTNILQDAVTKYYEHGL